MEDKFCNSVFVLLFMEFVWNRKEIVLLFMLVLVVICYKKIVYIILLIFIVFLGKKVCVYI